MDSFEINKVAGAVLFSLLAILGVKNLADYIYAIHPANPQAFVVEGAPAEGEGGATAAAEPAAAETPLPVLLAQADPKAGAAAAKKCQACHSFEEGAAPKIGPDLYGVVGRAVASAPGFNYSEAMKKKGGKWTFEELFSFIANPRSALSGTAMSFAGIKKPQERANVIAYLNTLGSNLPLPKAEGAAPAK